MSEPSKRELIEHAVVDSANELIREFQGNPYHFLYEAGLRGRLQCLLREKIGWEILVPRTGESGSKNPYRLKPAYSEYPVYEQSGRIDVACIDPVRASAVVPTRNSTGDTHLFCLPMHVAIELKLLKLGDKWDLPDRCEADREKLAALKQEADERKRLANGLVLGLVQVIPDLDPDSAGFFERARMLSVEGSLEKPPGGRVTSCDGVYLVTQDTVFKAARPLRQQATQTSMAT